MFANKLRLSLGIALTLLVSLQLWAEAAKKGWASQGQTWTYSKNISLTVPEKLKGSVEDGGVLLSIDDKSNHFWAGLAYSEDQKSADKFITAMRKHLKGAGELKLGKSRRLSDQDEKLHLKARVGTVVIDKVEFFVAMGYFTDKNEFLSFMVFYPSAQDKKFSPRVKALLNSVSIK